MHSPKLAAFSSQSCEPCTGRHAQLPYTVTVGVPCASTRSGHTNVCTQETPHYYQCARIARTRAKAGVTAPVQPTRVTKTPAVLHTACAAVGEKVGGWRMRDVSIRETVSSVCVHLCTSAYVWVRACVCARACVWGVRESVVRVCVCARAGLRAYKYMGCVQLCEGCGSVQGAGPNASHYRRTEAKLMSLCPRVCV